MSFRTSLLKTCQSIRVSVREGLDQCPSQLSIIQRTWSGGRVGAGTPTETTLIAFERYLPIRTMLEHEVPATGGLYTTGDVMVSRITPKGDGGVGYDPHELRPKVTTNGVEIIYRITGPLEGDYTCTDLRIGGRASHPGGYSGRGGVYSYALILRRVRNTPHL